MKEEFDLSEKMKWLLEALIEEEKESGLSIEYILMRAELEFKEFIRLLKEKLIQKSQSDDFVEIRQVEDFIDKLAGDDLK